MEWNAVECQLKKNEKKCELHVFVSIFVSTRVYVCTYCALMAIKSSSQVAFGVYRLTVTKKYSWFL